MDKKQLRNTLLLVCGAFIWGTAFVAQSVGSDYMGPYTFLAGRSWLACAFLLGLMAVLRKMGRTNTAAEPGFWQNKKVLVKGGIFCGAALFAASAAQQMGIGTTSTAKAGFMTALYVVLVPVTSIFFGSRPGVKLWGCVVVSVVGLYLLCLAGRDTLSLTGGEWQLLLCAALFTLQIMLVIDGVVLPTPNEYKVQLSDLDSSGTGRTEDGILVRERVRGGVAKISVSWAALSTADCARVLNATAPDSMQVAYFFGGTRTAKMYAGDRTADLKAAREGRAVWEVAVNLIEY